MNQDRVNMPTTRTPPAWDKAQTPSAIRNRRLRDRERLGQYCLTVPVDENKVAAYVLSVLK